jgi:hypothetical protein
MTLEKTKELIELAQDSAAFYAKHIHSAQAEAYEAIEAAMNAGKGIVRRPQMDVDSITTHKQVYFRMEVALTNLGQICALAEAWETAVALANALETQT